MKCARCGSRWHADGADPDTVSVETDLPADADAQAYAGTTAGGMDDDGLNADPADDWAAVASTVLVKGSRGAGMERVLQALLPDAGEAACS